MAIRAKSSGITLTPADVALVKGMLLRGDRQHDIAAWFGVNGGRIGEIASGFKFQFVEPISQDSLPPTGPYLTGQSAHAAMTALKQASESISKAQSLIC